MPTYNLLGKHFPVSGGTEFALLKSRTSPIALAKGTACRPVSFQYVQWGRTSGTLSGTSGLTNLSTPSGILTEWDYTNNNFTIDFDACTGDTVSVDLGTIHRRYYIPAWRYYPNYPTMTPYVDGTYEMQWYTHLTAEVIRLDDESERYAIPTGGKGSYIYPQLIGELDSYSESGSTPYPYAFGVKPPAYFKYFPRGCGPSVLLDLRADGFYDHIEGGNLGNLDFDFTSPCLAWSQLTSSAEGPAITAWVVNY